MYVTLRYLRNVRCGAKPFIIKKTHPLIAGSWAMGGGESKERSEEREHTQRERKREQRDEEGREQRGGRREREQREWMMRSKRAKSAERDREGEKYLRDGRRVINF